MLGQEQRLRRSSDIARVVRGGYCVGSRAVRLCVLRRARGATRVAAVAGTRVSRSAVVRHRYQRYLREGTRELLAAGVLPEHCDMVWVAQPGIVQLQGMRDVLPQMRRLVQLARVGQ